MKRFILGLLFLTATQLMAASYWDMKKEAYAAYHRGDKTGAIAIAQKFAQEHPKSDKAQNLLAVLYYWHGENEKAHTILRNLLSHTTYPEAAKLLARIEAKMGSKSKKMSYQAMRKRNQSTDLEYLRAQIENNPQDIQNRVLLSKYYFKHNAYQKAYDMAHEALEIDPHHKKMQTIVSHLEKRYKLSYSGAIDDESVVDKAKAKALLHKLHQEKKYAAFYNLYKALKDSHVAFSKKEYVDILHTAIMLGKYQEAQEMILKGKLAVNRDTLKVQLLLAKKLSQSVASR